MDTKESGPNTSNHLIPISNRALSIRSEALVLRGLRDVEAVERMQTSLSLSGKHEHESAQRILISIDNEHVRETVDAMLTAAGYQCRVSGRCTHADNVLLNSVVAGEEFQLVLFKGEQSSLEGLLDLVKEEVPDCPVIVLTATTDIFAALRAIEKGAYNYLLMPLARDQLQAACRWALETGRLKIENRAYQRLREEQSEEDLEEDPDGSTLTHVERILVVEDEKAVRDIICHMLTNVGYQCREAGDGIEALAVLESGGEFDLLLTNLLMPKLDGFGLFLEVKKKFPDMPVVIETYVNDNDIAAAAIREGVYDYLLKPFERWQLLAFVGRALEYRRLKQDNRRFREAAKVVERRYESGLEPEI